MSLPLIPPLPPQLALSRRSLPVGDGFSYEVKLDGFRCIAFVDDGEIFLQSRNGKNLRRYFPELRLPPGGYVLDGEIIVADEQGREDFDALSQRIHPAASRIALLAERTPARYVVFDLLARDAGSLLEQPFSARRQALEELLADESFKDAPVELMRSSTLLPDAERWLSEAEGVVAKEVSAPYLPGQRRGMVKVKRTRTIDAVLLGWRPGKAGTVGALILGLYDGAQLRPVGHCSGLSAAEKRQLVQKLRPYESGERGSSEPSRWSAGRDLEWIALRPELVVEVSFDHVSAGRIRHGARLLRWREDKDPQQCSIDQLV